MSLSLTSSDPIRENLPDGGYGWICVIAVFLINAHTWGFNSCYTVFLSYYLSEDLYPNASPLLYALVGGLSISCGLLVAPLTTLLSNVSGTRLVLNLGVFFQAITFIGVSFATQSWHLILSQGICFGIGMGFLFIGSVGIIPQWFDRRRGLAMGITASGSGIGGLIYSLAVGAMIPRLGLPWTFRLLDIVSFVVNAIAGNLIRDHNQAITGASTGASRPTIVIFHRPLFHQSPYLLFIAWGIFSMLGYVTLLFSISDYALSIGLTSHQASIVSALLNLGQGLGRTFIGFSSDRFGRLNIAALFTLFCGVCCLVIWVFATSMGVLCFFVLLAGSIAGTYFATVSPVLAEIVGLPDLLSGLSANWLFLVAPTLVAEPIALVMRNERSADLEYLPVEIFAGCMYIGGAMCLWVVRASKVCQLSQGEGEGEKARGWLDHLKQGARGFVQGAVAIRKV
ncbi:MFS transporter [Aspergillus sclerotioniger CBS 115572]|uniref:MFS transporter n=1 Tax=Aspergillus sclerotioniger CBS 115572 TaxID=1450535 RepID=A0A317WQ59_9EURO|nr:MFS transporter [Aspergillus sclerotioniger CBS 115572]PWY87267.1 MFS transporter [Aspergillus sclerotioniger CBS 115572]